MVEAAEYGAKLIPLTVTDLKQWAYCKRIVYYHHVMPVEFTRTYKMERGLNLNAVFEAMEKRRGFRRYGLGGGERRFGVSLNSSGLGLSGKPDLLVVTDKACFPVDFKDTIGGVRRNHRVQLAAYGTLIEDTLHLPVPAAFIYLVPSKTLIRVDVGERERNEVIAALKDIRRFILEERIPGPTPVRERCVGCEFRNYCDDIW